MNKTTNQMSQYPPANPITVYEMTGSDVHTFLNNQVISELPNTHDTTLFTAICNPKGRIIFTCILNLQNNCVLVAVDTSLSDNFLQYINMRRFRMDFMIKKSTLQLVFDHTAGLPTIAEDITFTTAPSSVQTADDWWQFMFKSGFPWVTAETTEAFIPQYVNLDQNDVIAFDKGCYPGQEIVARLHFLGKVKKRMQLIRYQSNVPLELKQLNLMPEMPKIDCICSPCLYDGANWTCQAIVKL